MVGLLVAEKAWCIDQAVIQGEIPVWFDILGMQDIDDLFRTAGDLVVKFGIWPCDPEEFYVFNPPFIHVIGMETRIKAGP